VRTTGQKAAADARIGAALARRKRAELVELLRPCFARTEPWLQAGKYAAALMSDLRRRNGRTIAERSGDRTPDRTQRLLNRQSGVKRQYLGREGKVANGINTVHREWIPAAQIGDPARFLGMGLPEDLVFRTKGQLATDILTEAFADGIRLDFVCGDEAYGSCTRLPEFREAHGQAYVARVPSSFQLMLPGGVTLTCKQAAGRLGSRRGWEIRSAGTGSKGHRWYAWA
jgi:SRSO17 transposase